MTVSFGPDRARGLNAELNLYSKDGKIQFEKDAEAARAYFLDHINQEYVFVHGLKEQLHLLLEEGYYEKEFLEQYTIGGEGPDADEQDFEFIRSAYRLAYGKKFRFPGLMGAYKFYEGYALKTFDNKRWLERYEDRVTVTALYLARGDKDLALLLIEEMMAGRFQPATPTFLNSGKKSRGDLVSCFLLRVEDNMESISRAINSSLQLSKRGGGVALNLSNLRAKGDPLKNMEGLAKGVVPVMKLLEDSFSYADQLGQRPGAGAVYLNAFHPDILTFLDTRRENADEKIRIKTLSLGVVVPDITFELAKKDEWMYTFSPYDVQRVYGVPFGDVSISEKYREMVRNPKIRKVKDIKAREFLTRLAEVQFESGYPYVLFEDTATEASPIKTVNGQPARINMSNLCSEILQVNSATTYNADLSYDQIGQDISCNLGSLNIAMAMDGGDLGKTVGVAIRALNAVSEMTTMDSVRSVENGNDAGHAIGLGQMNLHGYLARERVFYGSEEGVDFTNMYFYAVAYHAIKASNEIAIERGRAFAGFEESTYADGSYFAKYVETEWKPATQKVADLFAQAGIDLPTQADWAELRDSVVKHGIYNRNLQAVPPTGSISYINNSTASIHPITAKVEIRKEGKTGRLYYPAPFMTNDNTEYYQDAYEIGPEKLIDTYAAATQHVDQGLSLTLFFPESATTRDINRAQMYAWKKGIKTIYYIRVRQEVLAGTEVEGCVSCAL
jgi:ribonucleoside-diphosphate reductase alpha chain